RWVYRAARGARGRARPSRPLELGWAIGLPFRTSTATGFHGGNADAEESSLLDRDYRAGAAALRREPVAGHRRQRRQVAQGLQEGDQGTAGRHGPVRREDSAAGGPDGHPAAAGPAGSARTTHPSTPVGTPSTAHRGTPADPGAA